MNITREKVFTDLVCVEKLGKLSAEEQLKLAETIGEVEKPDLNNERHKELFDKWGMRTRCCKSYRRWIIWT